MEFKSETNSACHKGERQSAGLLFQAGLLAQQQTDNAAEVGVFCVRVDAWCKHILGPKFRIMSGKEQTVLSSVVLNLNQFIT